MNGNVWMIVVAMLFVSFAIFYWNQPASKRCNKCKRRMRSYKGESYGNPERTYYCRWCKSSACIQVKP